MISFRWNLTQSYNKWKGYEIDVSGTEHTASVCVFVASISFQKFFPEDNSTSIPFLKVLCCLCEVMRDMKCTWCPMCDRLKRESRVASFGDQQSNFNVSALRNKRFHAAHTPIINAYWRLCKFAYRRVMPPLFDSINNRTKLSQFCFHRIWIFY